MGLLRNVNIETSMTMYARLPKMSVWKINGRLNEMEKQGLLEGENTESWWTRNYNPKLVATLTDGPRRVFEKQH